MHHKILPLSLMVASLIASSVSLAQTPQPFTPKVNKNIAASEEYWTPERMQTAVPLELPRVDINRAKTISIEQAMQEEANAGGTTSLGEDGSPPTLNVKPNMQPIFKPLLQSYNDKAPQNSGTRNEQFSSSQLVPLAADLSYPYRTVGKLFFTIPGAGNYLCSASVIKPRVIVTAGHCVHSGSDGVDGYYTNWKFVPAYRDGAAPFQSWNWSYVITTTPWATGGDAVPNAADYAMIELRDNVINGVTTRIGNVTGWLGYQTQSLIPNHAHLLGYPCNFDSCQKMHQVTAESAVAIAPNNVEYGSDMQGGSSGGPWVQNFGTASVGQSGGNNPGMNRVIAVTSWGWTNAAAMGQGASNFDGNFTAILNTICAHQANNC